MSRLPVASRLALLAGLAAAAGAVAPARAQLFQAGAAPLGDVQSLNFAGGGTYVEGLWMPYARFSRAAAFQGGNGEAEVRGAARPSFGAEGRYVLPAVPWLFGTAEYRYEDFNKARVQMNGQEVANGRLNSHGNIFRVGAGARIPTTPFYGRAEFVDLRESADTQDGFGGNGSGVGVYGGVAQPLTRWLGVRGEAGYQHVNGLGEGFAWRAGGNLNLTPLLALTAEYRLAQMRKDNENARLQEVAVGLRFQFSH